MSIELHSFELPVIRNISWYLASTTANTCNITPCYWTCIHQSFAYCKHIFQSLSTYWLADISIWQAWPGLTWLMNNRCFISWLAQVTRQWMMRTYNTEHTSGSLGGSVNKDYKFWHFTSQIQPANTLPHRQVHGCKMPLWFIAALALTLHVMWIPIPHWQQGSSRLKHIYFTITVIIIIITILTDSLLKQQLMTLSVSAWRLLYV